MPKNRLGIKFTITGLLLILICIFEANTLYAELPDDVLENPLYLISFVIVSRNSGLSDIYSLKNKKLGFLHGSIHQMHAENIIDSTGNESINIDLKGFNEEEALKKLINGELSFIFFTVSLNEFKNSKFYNNIETKLLSLPANIIHFLKSTYRGYNYDFIVYPLSKLTGIYNDDDSVTLLISTTPYATRDDYIKLGINLPELDFNSEINAKLVRAIHVAKAIQPQVLGQKVRIQWGFKNFVVDPTMKPFIVDPTMKPYIYDVEKAKKLLKEAGYPKGFNIGPALSHSYPSISINNFYDDAKYPISIFIPPKKTSSDYLKYYFNLSSPIDFPSKLFAKFLFNSINMRTAVIIQNPSSIYSRNKAQLFRSTFLRLGGSAEILSVLLLGHEGFSPLVEQIRSKSPDFIFAPVGKIESVSLSIKLDYSNIDLPVFYSALNPYFPFIYATDSKSLKFIIKSPSSRPVSYNLGNMFFSEYTKTYGHNPHEISIKVADSYYFLLEAIKRANSTNPQKIRTALLDSKKIEGLSGTYYFLDSGQTRISVPIFEFTGSKYIHVASLDPITEELVKSPNELKMSFQFEDAYGPISAYDIKKYIQKVRSFIFDNEKKVP